MVLGQRMPSAHTQVLPRYPKKIFEEAGLCIDDLRVATEEERTEETVCARTAVDNVFQSYLDFLDDLRVASDEQLEAYGKSRASYALKLKQLRVDLGEIMKEHS